MLVIAGGILLAILILMIARNWLVILSLIILCIVAFSAHSQEPSYYDRDAHQKAMEFYKNWDKNIPKSVKAETKTNNQFINLGDGRVQSPDGRIFSPPSGSAFDSLVRNSPQGPMVLCSGNMALKPPDCKQYKDEFIQHQMQTPQYQYLGSIGQCRYQMLMMGHKNPVSVCG